MAKLEEALVLKEATVKAAEDRMELIKAKANEEKVKASNEAKLRGIKEFKASEKFENKVVEGFSIIYVYGLEACKACFIWMVSKLDLSHLHSEDSNNEGGAFSLDEDEPALAEDKSTPVENKLAPAEDLAPTIDHAMGGPTEETIDHPTKPMLEDLD
ncbi:hypothetical protein COCNU_05G000690 [Cocos nucifera]|uniref:Uncharacterized protein n=1 Tax=Cocos nucifera TaxID=13894 RepID=A0A8K0I8S6_COCNU|nr:hypothetical protein COCNU_05G000690 [Cocos nucifera]